MAEALRKYSAHDVSIALNVSDLWLPNISSQVKHALAFLVLGSLNLTQFAVDRRMDSYSSFAEFIQKLYAILPSFPTLEDYVPEADWGEIKIGLGGRQFKIFYGSSVERIPDYVEAFRLINSTRPQLADLRITLGLQDQLLSMIDRSISGDAGDVAAGHIEVPSEGFWNSCRAAITSLADHADVYSEMSRGLVAKLGTFGCPKSYSEFGDLLMTGRLPPAPLLEIDGKHYPMSLRNALSLVIDYWADHDRAHNTEIDATSSLSAFLTERFGHQELLTGPFTIVSRKAELPYRFAALMHENEECHFIIPTSESQIKLLSDVERDVFDFFSNNSDWGLRLTNQNRFAQLRDQDGNLLTPKKINIVAVIATSGTAWRVLHPPETDIKILWLPDFVTIFDSLEDLAELGKFWHYLDSTKPLLGGNFIGTADLFATFRDSYAVPIEGAVTPDLMFFDPHWGSNWRFKELLKFWQNSPSLFPDSYRWSVEPAADGIQRLISKVSPSVCWSTTIGGCVVQFVCHFSDQHLDSLNGPILETMIHCLADSLSQRRLALERLPLFTCAHIVTVCIADPKNPANERTPKSGAEGSLFDNWQLDLAERLSPRVGVSVNLAYAQASLTNAQDNKFETECAGQWTKNVVGLLGQTIAQLDLPPLSAPRFSFAALPRTIDAPDLASPTLPKPTQYKLARREVSIIFKSLNVKPGRYELRAAKAAIDPIRDEFRRQIHARISRIDRTSLVLYCIQELDCLTIDFLRTNNRVRHSLSHQVNFDRAETLAEAHDKFSSNSRNYRYLLEVSLSQQVSASTPVTSEVVLQLIAEVDWLFVLYSASDVLHNDIEVAGIELDTNFVPTIFYSDNRDESEKAFGLEMASDTLGLDLDPSDRVVASGLGSSIWYDLNLAFRLDTGFSFEQLLHVLEILSRWQTIRGKKDFHLSYHASADEIADWVQKTVPDVSAEEARQAINFLTIQPSKIRRLIGKSEDEGDVPTWEHFKRDNRYTIKPLVPTGENTVAWGAGSAERSLGIWRRSIAGGYLPADFNWPHVQTAIRALKEGLEKQLEKQAGNICSRFASFVEIGIDFKRRFPKERFDDVGDFDVLAYWPLSNIWLVVECKYNQPPFCLKDARRLRERIFGIAPDRGQFSKIERRREFLRLRFDKLRQVLGWPVAQEGIAQSIHEVYVSRDIYWWMRNPPYPVPSEFVRVDALDSWIRAKNLSKN